MNIFFTKLYSGVGKVTTFDWLLLPFSILNSLFNLKSILTSVGLIIFFISESLSPGIFTLDHQYQSVNQLLFI